MDTTDFSWNRRVADLWREIDRHPPDAFLHAMEALAAEMPPGSAVALFERGCAQDSTGHPDRAVPLYRAALAAGLAGIRRRRATIQLASSLRNLGQVQEAIDLLSAEIDAASDALDAAVRGFLALALADAGREREALSHVLGALSRYLPRYNRSLARYARALAPEGRPDPPSEADVDWQSEIEALEADANEAFLKRDLARLDELFSDELVVNSPINRINDKPTLLRLLGTGVIGHVESSFRHELIRREGDLVTVMGADAVRNSPAEATLHRRFTNIWRREGDRWRLYVRHANVIASAAPPASQRRDE